MRKIWYLNGKRKDRHGGTEQWVSPRLLVALSPRVLFFFYHKCESKRKRDLLKQEML